MAVFGDTDTRREFSQIQAADRKELCRSIGAVVEDHEIVIHDGAIDLSKLPLHGKNILTNPALINRAKAKGVTITSIDETKVFFTQQPTLPYGTAFLVAEDIVASAAHVIFPLTREHRDMTTLSFVLDYWIADNGKIVVPEASIFNVKEIILQTFDFGLNKLNPDAVWRGVEDFVFLRLERKVTKRPILKFGLVDPVLNDPLWSTGYGSGLPLKYKENPKGCRGTGALDKNQSYRHALTSYGGDSGAPIFNTHNEVIGIATSVATLPGHYDFTAAGVVVPIFRPFFPTDADDKEMAYAYRSTIAQWAMNPHAYMQATLTFEEAEKGESESFNVEISTFGGKATAPFAADDFDITIDCPALLTDEDQGIISLTATGVYVQLDDPKKAKGALVRRLTSVVLIVSQGKGSSPSVQVALAGLDKPFALMNGAAHMFDIAKILPLQK